MRHRDTELRFNVKGFTGTGFMVTIASNVGKRSAESIARRYRKLGASCVSVVQVFN